MAYKNLNLLTLFLLHTMVENKKSSNYTTFKMLFCLVAKEIYGYYKSNFCFDVIYLLDGHFVVKASLQNSDLVEFLRYYLQMRYSKL
jgi:hypothetical protein